MKFPVRSLNRLCAAYDRLSSSSFIVDLRALDGWQAQAEKVMESCFAPARSDSRISIALCRCLTCYFYEPCPDRDDEWYAYLMATADAWVASLSPEGSWEGLPLTEALDRIEVMNRISYMQLDHSRDTALRRAYEHYAHRLSRLEHVPAPVLKRWQLLGTEGNALPLTSPVCS